MSLTEEERDLTNVLAGGMVSGEADGHGPLRFQHRQALPLDRNRNILAAFGIACGARFKRAAWGDAGQQAMATCLPAGRSAAPLTMPPA